MKKLWLIVFVLLFAACHRAEAPTSGPSSLLTLGETRADVPLAAPTPTLLHFWATWCPPCREELPAFQRYAATAESRGVRVVAIAVDPNVSDVTTYLREQSLKSNTLVDPKGDFAAKFGVEVLPSTIVLDRSGKAVRTVVGSVEWDNPDVVAQLVRLGQ